MWREPAGWRMNDRGVEAEQERRVVYSIPYPVTMLSQRRRGKGVLQGCELGTCVSAFRERARKKEDFKNMCTCNCVHAFVCACAKAWKAASQTVISKTMCQLTEGTHAPLYSGLSSGPALCLFFLQ